MLILYISVFKGEISRSLYLDLEELGAPSILAVAMAGVYAWTIDFTHVQEGDVFDVYYSREIVNGKPVGYSCNTLV